MLVRIVRMTFQPEKIAHFVAIFEASQTKIRAMPGCQHLELLRDVDAPHIFVTHSHWDNADVLNAYRHSDFFRDTWAKTKVLFADKPLAFSLEKI